MLSRMLVVATFTLLFTSACVPPSLPVPTTPTPPPPAIPVPTPTHQTPTSTTQTTRCVVSNSIPAPSLPDTDCMAWEMLYSLAVSMPGMLVDKNQHLTESELAALETELYPLFVQAHLNCGESTESVKDYEGFTDSLFQISYMGLNEHDYDPYPLFLFLVEGAATEGFASLSIMFGCHESLLMIYGEYSE